MKVIDGSEGEGGGQMLRTSLSLSMVTGRAFRIENIRAGRSKPGLLRQHLAAVLAAKAISQADVEGAELGSKALVFRPGKVRAGEYKSSIGSAGAAGLVFQTVLPALLAAEGESTVVFEGGTHNPNAPPFDFLAETFVPLLARIGINLEVRLERAGFYPAGGGRFVARISPAKAAAPLQLLERGEVSRVEGRVLCAGVPRHVGDRECAQLCEDLGIPREQTRTHLLDDSLGTGNVVMVVVQSAALTELFTAFGERGVRAEEVARKVSVEAQNYLRAGAPVGEHLADQLLLPLALGAGGTYRCHLVSQHTRTQIDMVREWLGSTIHVREAADRTAVIEVLPR